MDERLTKRLVQVEVKRLAQVENKTLGERVPEVESKTTLADMLVAVEVDTHAEKLSIVKT